MSQPITHLVNRLDDPRVTGDDFRHVPAIGDAGDVVLVGVVHDHPASVFRVVEAVSALDPDTVGLEVASIAVPLFRSYAETHGSDPDTITSVSVDGGEMSAAIGAAGDACIVGIDLPNPSALEPVLSTLHDESLPAREALRAGHAFGAQMLHAIQCRISHAASRIGLDIDPGLDREPRPDARTASPAKQASDEAVAISAGETLLRALSRPPAMEAFDRAREAAMAQQLRLHCQHGVDVVAVLGYAHLDPIAERLEGERRPR